VLWLLACGPTVQQRADAISLGVGSIVESALGSVVGRVEDAGWDVTAGTGEWSVDSGWTRRGWWPTWEGSADVDATLIHGGCEDCGVRRFGVAFTDVREHGAPGMPADGFLDEDDAARGFDWDPRDFDLDGRMDGEAAFDVPPEAVESYRGWDWSIVAAVRGTVEADGGGLDGPADVDLTVRTFLLDLGYSSGVEVDGTVDDLVIRWDWGEGD
jgi:hypothetical protein